NKLSTTTSTNAETNSPTTNSTITTSTKTSVLPLTTKTYMIAPRIISFFSKISKQKNSQQNESVNITILVNILSTQIDLNNCLTNCSNHGECIYDTLQDNFCSNEFYSGRNCEIRKDVCLNETCSNKGNCYDSNFTPKCICFNMYSGDKCEIEANDLKTIKSTVKVTSIVAIICLVCFYGLFISIDIVSFFKMYNDPCPDFRSLSIGPCPDFSVLVFWSVSGFQIGKIPCPAVRVRVSVSGF
ncbi:unnamed protein product, partial [Brachionus calyciflorus]